MNPKAEEEREALFLTLTDDAYRNCAAELHEREWVVEVSEDAKVIRPTEAGECAWTEVSRYRTPARQQAPVAMPMAAW